MTRFWLLLLVLVLPAQMSWAAVHYCGDEGAGVSGAVVAQLQHAYLTDATHAPKERGSNLPVDTCCVAAHACHGLDSALDQPDVLLASMVTPAAVFVRHVAPTGRDFASRHERPQWLAA